MGFPDETPQGAQPDDDLSDWHEDFSEPWIDMDPREFPEFDDRSVDEVRADVERDFEEQLQTLALERVRKMTAGAYDLFYQTIFWKTKDGRLVSIDRDVESVPRIDHNHALNLVRWMERNAESLWWACQFSFPVPAFPMGDAAEMALGSIQFQMERSDPLEFIRATPLYLAVKERADSAPATTKILRPIRNRIWRIRQGDPRSQKKGVNG